MIVLFRGCDYGCASMQIGVSARGLSVPLGGARRILDELLTWLPVLGHGHDIRVYQPPGTRSFEGTGPVRVSAPHPVLWERVALPRALARTAPDVFLSPKTLLPARLPPRTRTAIMVLDLLYFSIRGRYLHEYKWADILYMRRYFLDACRRADAILCISESTRRDLLSLCPLPEARIHVVPLGVGLPEPHLLSPNRIEEVRRRYGLERPYIFYAGSLSPRKNMVRGVRAWASIAGQIPHDLVVTAGKSWRDRSVKQSVRTLGMSDRFRRLGAVPPDDLASLYAGADICLYPSLYEGFGLPVLEAMSCGCPVVTSDAAAIPEVAADAARLVDPESEEAMAAALLDVLTDTAEAGRLREMGRIRAASFPWQKTVQSTLHVLEGIVA